MVPADEALRIGLVDVVVPSASVYSTARELVSKYASGPAAAIRAAKAAIDGGLSMDLASGLAWETQLFAALFATEDKTEGMSAFVEKRPAKFTGR
jgi:enoyl-CoA hydratase/carnithine racemase